MSVSLTDARSTELYARALQRLPGGVNSPVRAMGAIGRDPVFIERGHGAEIVDVDGSLHVLVCGQGKVRQFAAGQARDALKAADFARFALRRMARSRPGADPASARGSLRLSLGHTSTEADVDAALAVLPAAVERARQAALASAGAAKQ